MRSPVVSPELKAAMKALRLGKLLDTLPERLGLAKKDGMSIDDFLLSLFTDEIARRRSSATAGRADEARLHPDMVMERWDATAKVHLDRRALRELSTLRFLQAHRNVVVSRSRGRRKDLPRERAWPSRVPSRFSS